jgi:hypothetical protein
MPCLQQILLALLQIARMGMKAARARHLQGAGNGPVLNSNPCPSCAGAIPSIVADNSSCCCYTLSANHTSGAWWQQTRWAPTAMLSFPGPSQQPMLHIRQVPTLPMLLRSALHAALSLCVTWPRQRLCLRHQGLRGPKASCTHNTLNLGQCGLACCQTPGGAQNGDQAKERPLKRARMRRRGRKRQRRIA